MSELYGPIQPLYIDSHATEAAAISGIIALVIFAMGLNFLFRLVNGSQTRQYRKKLADMYVSGKIRKLAEKDGIKINDELKAYVMFTKHEKKFMQELDDAVETELNAQMSEPEAQTK